MDATLFLLIAISAASLNPILEASAEDKKCTVSDDDLMLFVTAWTENNPDVQAGYELSTGEILHVSECKECLCTSSGSLSCSEVKTPLPNDDQCVIITCTPAYERKPLFKSESCRCAEREELVVAPAPACCECRTNKCTVTHDDLFLFEPAWTENNTDVQSGDELYPGELLHISDCKECLCTKNGSFSCSARRTQVPYHDPCVIITCTAGYERHPYFKAESCRCAKDERLVIVSAPVCCQCVSNKCTVTDDDLMLFVTAWTENNSDVQPGDELNSGELLHASECKECLCTSDGSLNCSEVKTPLPNDDQCVIITCTSSYERKPFFKSESCHCAEYEELVVVPAPTCCECRTNKKCTVTDDDLFLFEPAWTENNIDVQAGDELYAGELLHISDCKECLCTANGSLSCSARKTQVPFDDPCVIVTCTAGYERHPYFKAESCRCAKDEHIVAVPAPACCECQPGSPPDQKGDGYY